VKRGIDPRRLGRGASPGTGGIRVEPREVRSDPRRRDRRVPGRRGGGGPRGGRRKSEHVPWL